MGRPDLTDNEATILQNFMEMINFKNDYYNKLQEIYTDYADNFLIRNTMTFDTAEKTRKEANNRFILLRSFYESHYVSLPESHREIVWNMMTWWKLFLQEIEQNQLVAKRFIAHQQTNAPYSLFAQFADKRQGQNLNKTENKLITDISYDIDKHIL